MIKTVDLTKIYRTCSSAIVAVNHVNLRVRRGSFISIIGPSGAGKTTLLNLIGLIDKPTYG
ncbi:MAG TPA: ATP-binding cassette domain-containing protein, partial [Candidatus Bathyarchaeota archaeon]|nr:ATP-binding cassette domain-containing protein [Candidatus Bathyarchaeota archaeon]